MKDEIVSFETAKLAKKKGFDWKVTLHYESNGNRFFDKVECNFNNVELICSAPTQSLLQKWLREVHNTDITVITDWIKSKRFYYIGLSFINNKKEIDIWFSKDSNELKIKYDTYEQALEAGLQEALKLIKDE